MQKQNNQPWYYKTPAQKFFACFFSKNKWTVEGACPYNPLRHGKPCHLSRRARLKSAFDKQTKKVDFSTMFKQKKQPKYYNQP